MKDMRRVFAEWPASIPRTGMIVTTFGESIPFVTYMLSGDLLLVRNDREGNEWLVGRL